VLGIATRSGILLITRYQRLEREEGEAFGPAIVERGTRERLGPILASATAIGAAVLPMVFYGNTAGLEILHPMAVVILGGLVVSIVMNLFVIPSLYLRLASAQPQPKTSAADGSEQHA
jgi:Cu/Ag efflux pump CusA